MTPPRLLPTLAAVLLAARATLAVEAPVVSVDTSGPKIVVRSQAGEASIRRSRVQLTIRDGTTRKRLVRERPQGGLFYERGGVVHELAGVISAQILPDGVELTVGTDEDLPALLTVRFLTARTLEVALDPPDPATLEAVGDRLRSPRSEAIYGLTERLRDSPVISPGVLDFALDDIAPPEVGSLDRRGEQVEMRIIPTFSLYVPFFQSSRGYGLAVAGTTFGLFDVAKTDTRVVSFRFETGSTPASRRLVYRVFVGPAHGTVLDEYTNLTGRPFVPPGWAFLHWRWRGELTSGPTALLDGLPVNADVADDVNNYDAYGIPSGVYLFDRPVLPGNFGFARFEWDEVRLPNTAYMLNALRTRGFHLAMWSSTWTCGSGPSDNGTQAQALGYLAPGSAGTPNCADVGGTSFIMDVTNPAARSWWAGKLAAFLAANGIQAIKLDRGEEHIPSEATDVWADGRTGREVRNDYPRLQAMLHHDALASAFPPGAFALLTRSAYTGTAQYGIFWGGDIPGSEGFGAGAGTDLGLRSAIISQQRAAFMGMPIWGSDTGGYYEFKDREVFARWLEFSCFSGLMEIGGVGKHAPWSMPTTPALDTEMIDIYVRYTRLRQTLQPYIVAAAAEAAQGMPIVRPMPFEDQKDHRLRDRWDQYLFGPDLLVAPVWKVGARSREVYLPRGRWRNYFDPSQVVDGPALLTVDVPLDAIAVFARDGAVVPGP
jgi:alpha-glucosidase (family GH31 glycosyl hydrolase)